MRSLTPEQLDARLGDRFRLLASGSRTALPRHQTLRAAIDWSHRLLEEPEQLVFRRLSVFAGGCPLEAAEEVCADDGVDVLLTVAALVDKSLLVHEATESRYRMLETIREFAWAKLVDAGELDACQRRHRDWCLTLAEAAEYNSSSAAAWEARLATEQDNFRAALAWDGPAGDDGDTRLRLAAALWLFWWSRAQSAEGREWLERALQAGQAAPAAARANALAGVGVLAMEQGDAVSALAFHRQSLQLYEQLGDRRGVAEVLLGMGHIAALQGRHGEGRATLEDAVRAARAAQDERLTALARNHLGTAIYLQGDPASARLSFELARDGMRSVGNLQGAAVTTIEIGLCALELGQHNEASSLVREGLRTTHELDFRWGELFGLDASGLLATRTGNWEAAAILFGATELLRTSSPAPLPTVRESGIAAMTAALDPAALTRAWDSGNAMTLDQAITYALDTL
jgi:tetratricopeptide (TPR) repeat protein